MQASNLEMNLSHELSQDIASWRFLWRVRRTNARARTEELAILVVGWIDWRISKHAGCFINLTGLLISRIGADRRPHLSILKNTSSSAVNTNISEKQKGFQPLEIGRKCVSKQLFRRDRIQINVGLYCLSTGCRTATRIGSGPGKYVCVPACVACGQQNKLC